MTTSAIPEIEPQLLVAAENLLTRAGLSALLEEGGFPVLAQVDGLDLQRQIDRYQPDMLIIDLGWAASPMRANLSQIETDLPILLLVPAADAEDLAPLLQLLPAFPQFALLLRDSDADFIIAALDALASGLTVIQPRLASLWSASSYVIDGNLPSPLTARESEVLQHVARGLTNRAIALELGITQHTVKFHINAILGKLAAQSRTEAVVRATQLGLITL